MNVIDGTSKKEVINGTTLQDIISGFAGNDTIDGSDGDDFIYGSSGSDKIFGSAGDDYIVAGSGNDYVSDGDGNDIVFAGEGDDHIKVGRGDDIFHGGKGFDTIDFGNARQGVTADLSKGIVTGRGTDVVQGFERFIGSSHGDTIKGSNNVEIIEAGEGMNVIRSLGGADVIVGGYDRDIFAFESTDVLATDGTHRGVDVIFGFEYNDGLDLSGMLEGLDFDQVSIDDHVRLTTTETGTMVQVRQGDAFVDVALLANFDASGGTATGWASDGLILSGT